MRYKNELNNFGHIDELDKIVCPYCEYEHELHTDYFGNGAEFEDEDFQCCKCEQFFKVEGRVEYEFWGTTTPLPRDKRN